MALGYEGDLHILAFGHRGSFFDGDLDQEAAATQISANHRRFIDVYNS